MSDTNEKQEDRRKPIVVGISLGSIRGKDGKCSPLSGLIWGVIVALVGVVILLDNMGILEANHLYRFWPSLLVLAGILNLGSRSSRMFGAILILAGALLQLGALGVGHFTWGTLWALIFIVAGFSIIWGSIEGRTTRPPNTGETSNTMNAVAVFSGVERRISSQDFQFGRVMAIFGGAEIRVPDSWQVVSRGQFVFAGFSDKTRDVSTVDLSNPNRKTLIISGISLFGGVEIKN
jgi:hypothetical protein